MVLGDAHSLPFKPAAAGCVLVFYFLMREIMADLTGLLMPGGLLLYETFLKRQNRHRQAQKPRLSAGRRRVAGLFPRPDLLFYEEGIFSVEGKQRALARYVGRKR